MALAAGGANEQRGGGPPRPIELIAVGDLRRQFEINLFGLVRVTQAYLPLIRQAQGRIINIGSVGGRLTIPFGGALCISKYALEAINDALRKELTPWGIHVVLVAPAGIATPAVNRLLDDGDAAIARFSPEGRQHYERSFRAFLASSVVRERKGSSPDVVARAVLKALTALTWLPRLLPARGLDRLRFHLFGLPGRFGGEANSASRDLG